MQRNTTLPFAIFASLAGTLIAQNNLPQSAIPKPDPAEQMATFILDEGLEINLFAADPMIAKPIAMNWDAEGRLFVVSSRLYPHIKPGERSTDQVIVLEDKDGDGVADESTVFAEDLLIPTGIMPGDGGAYVANSTEILFIKDTDGDLKGDVRKVVLSGFGTEDTHHIIHAFRGGPDGMLYFNQSIYIHSHIETPHGLKRLMAGGIWHYRPETGELDVFARGFVNSWGHAFDRYGQSFATDGAFGEGINYVFPGSVFVTAYNSKRIMRGLNPGQPKQCGLEIVNSSHFPDDWQGSLITNDFRGHRVNRFVVSESGSGYVSRQAPDPIRTSHGAFRPIDVKVGPDGALYIADWYNPIIQHGEVDFRDPRRDHTHGRIWRVTHKGRPLVKKPQVKGQPLDKVVPQLRSPEAFNRHFAKRELRSRPAEAKLALDAFLKTPELSDADKLEVLWGYQSINLLNDALMRELLASSDHRVRAAAVRVLYHWHGRVADALSLLGFAVADEHPQVRLEAVNALRQVRGKEAFALAMRALDKPVDGNIDFALWLTARELESDWLPALERAELDLAGQLGALNFALKAVEKPGALRFLRDSLATELPDADFRKLATLFGDVGAADDLAALYASALQKGRDAGARGHAFGQLLRAAESRKAKPADIRASDLLALVAAGDEPAARLCGAWSVAAARGEMVKWLGDDSKVATAAATLVGLGGGESKASLEALANDGARPMASRAEGVAGVAQLDLAAGATCAAKLFAEAKTAEGLDSAFRIFLAKDKGADALAKALVGKKVASAVATAGVKIAGASGGKTASLVAALTKAGDLEPLTRALSAAEMQALVAKVRTEGDAKRGELVYRRANLLCQTCHAIGGGGGVIGPDLVSIGASAPVDYIVDSLLEPAKKIKEGYHTTVVITKGGAVVTGGLVRETDSDLVIRLADGSEQLVPIASVAKKEIVPISLMPAGLTASLRKDELIDLVRFMSELGKEGAYKVPSGRLVRRWRVLPYDDEVSNQIRRIGTQAMLGAAVERPWRAAYSMVNGDLPLSEMGINKGFNNDLSFAKFEVEVSVAGEIGLRIDNPQGLQIMVGGAMLDAQKASKAVLAPGTHEIIVLVDRAARSDGGLRVELFDVEGSAGRADVVGGL